MDAAVALQRKKTIKFLCIVDFQLSKQGIFFITLTQKAVAKILPQLFSLLYRTKSAKAVTDFQSAFYRDVQLLPGGWIFLLPTFSAAFGMLRQYRIILSADTASEVRQPPERCLSRKAGIIKAGIMRCCLKHKAPARTGLHKPVGRALLLVLSAGLNGCPYRKGCLRPWGPGSSCW